MDRGLVDKITGCDTRTVPDAGWAGLKNGDLLSRAQVEFDVFITTDRNLMFQQNLPKFDIAVIVLSGRTNRLQDLLPLVPRALGAIVSAQPGEPIILES